MSLPQHLSVEGAKFIAQFEGFSPDWYKDPVGVNTIGYGHTGPLPKGMHPPLTHPEALHLLVQDAEKVAAVVREVRPRVRNQARFDALVSFGYNLGPGYFLDKSTSIGRALAARVGRVKKVHDAILLYHYAGGRNLPGLLRRREAEAKVWTDGHF